MKMPSMADQAGTDTVAAMPASEAIAIFNAARMTALLQVGSSLKRLRRFARIGVVRRHGHCASCGVSLLLVLDGRVGRVGLARRRRTDRDRRADDRRAGRGLEFRIVRVVALLELPVSHGTVDTG